MSQICNARAACSSHSKAAPPGITSKEALLRPQRTHIMLAAVLIQHLEEEERHGRGGRQRVPPAHGQAGHIAHM